MNALDILGVGAEVGGVVDFVLEELEWLVSEGLFWTGGRERTHNASDFVAKEIGWLVLIIT